MKNRLDKIVNRQEAINKIISKYLDESQIFRVDHYWQKILLEHWHCYGSPIACLNRYGIVKIFDWIEIALRETVVLMVAGCIMINMAHSKMWFKIICSRLLHYWRWKRPFLTGMQCEIKLLVFCKK